MPLIQPPTPPTPPAQDVPVTGLPTAADVGTAQPISLARPMTQADLEALKAKRSELSRQISSATERRKDVVRELVGSSRVDLQACKLEYSIVSPK